MKLFDIILVSGACGRIGRALHEIQEPGSVDDRHVRDNCGRKPANGLEIKTATLTPDRQQLEGLQK